MRSELVGQATAAERDLLDGRRDLTLFQDIRVTRDGRIGAPVYVTSARAGFGMTAAHDLFEQRKKREQPHYEAVLNAIRASIGPEKLHQLLLPLFPSNSALSADATYDAACSDVVGEAVQWLQRRISDPDIRGTIARKIAEISPAPPPPPETITVLNHHLTTTGFVPIRPLLDAHEVSALAAHLSGCKDFQKSGPLFHNLVADIAAAPHALKIATDPLLLWLAATFLKCAPTIIGIDAWLSPVMGGVDQGAQVVHRDKDDFRACKFFMYLTDVGPEDGPYAYVQYSHDRDVIGRYLSANNVDTGLLEYIFQISNGGRDFADVNNLLFKPLTVEALGPAGTCFMVNSFGLHRGRPPTRGCRGMLAITYGMVTYPDRLSELVSTNLKALPAECFDAPIARYAARNLIWAQERDESALAAE